MAGFRVGLMDMIVAGRPAADTFTRSTYLSAVGMAGGSSDGVS
jgi:phthiodiolone/phenolphthiodiolone dimycocerosates ketoreductase